MKNYVEDIEEIEHMSENYGSRGFVKVPIEEAQNSSIEVYNVYKGIDLSKTKWKKKLYRAIIVILVVCIFYMLSKIIKITLLANNGLHPILNNDNIQEAIDQNTKKNEFNNYDEEEPSEPIYVFQKKEKIDLSQFSSPQLRKPENIKLIKKLEISLDLEYDKIIHLKIKDAENKRWEVPEADIIDEEYISNLNDNRVGMSKLKSKIYSQYFYIDLLSNITSNNNEKNITENNNNTNENIQEEFGFKIMTQGREEIYSFTTSKNFLFSDTYINFESKLSSDKIYGFGERTHDFQLKEGTYTIWPNDCGGTEYDDGFGGKNQYSHQPIGLHRTKFEDFWLGFIFLNTNSQDVVIHSDSNKNTYLTHRTIGGIIDYFIIVCDTPEDVIKTIQMILGSPPLPPFWSMGIHQSRYGYKSSNDFKEIYEKYKSLNISIDAMWIDIDSLKDYELFTINDNFKELANYVDDVIHIDGGKFVPIVDYGFSYENKDNQYIKLGEELNIFIKSNYTKENLIGKAWSGKTVFPDFFHPNIPQFWNKGLEDYYQLIKYDGIWLDMNEPANLLEDKNAKCIAEIADEKDCTPDKNKYNNDDLPYIPGYRNNVKETLSMKSISENAIISGNNTVYDTKPMLSYYQTKYTYMFLNSNFNSRAFILSRSTSIGSGKYTFHWLGDNFSTFQNLKNSISGIFNFNIFGIPFTGADICGFMKDAIKNLCIRWYNIGVFYPFSRNHNFFEAKDQYPWSFGEDATNIIKKNINYRYSLLRYFYSQFFLISNNEKGSFFKPLMFEFPDDETSYVDIESKIMIGEAFLLCAFLEDNENDKKFTFPNSHFNYYPSGKVLFNYNDEENIQNKKDIELSGKFDQIHLFMRGGYIIPYQDTFNKYILNSNKLKDEKINLIVNIDNYLQSRGEIFFDNDEHDTVIQNKYFRVDMYYNEKALTFTTYKKNLEEYKYNDHIIGKIEFWRISEILQTKKKPLTISCNITFNENSNLYPQNIQGNYDQENDKVIFEISKEDISVSIFNIYELLIN